MFLYTQVVNSTSMLVSWSGQCEVGSPPPPLPVAFVTDWRVCLSGLLLAFVTLKQVSHMMEAFDVEENSVNMR